MSALNQKETKWGWLAMVKDGDETLAEVMYFEKPGTFHKHDKEEIVICVGGSGHFVVEDLSHPSGVKYFSSSRPSSNPMRIPAGKSHRMEPDHEDPYGMTCVLWYE